MLYQFVFLFTFVSFVHFFYGTTVSDVSALLDPGIKFTTARKPNIFSPINFNSLGHVSLGQSIVEILVP